jgi:hypothetical protein
MLAGVRDECGFVTLAKGRGLPKDLSFPPEPDWKAREACRDENPWLGDHSFSWCLLSEALAFNYDRVARHSGVVDSAQYAEWRAKEPRVAPDHYCKGVGGGRVKMVSNEEMSRLILSGVAPRDRPEGNGHFDFLTAKDGNEYFTVVEWDEAYRESAGEAWFRFLDSLKVLGKPERIRLVFGFDS